MRPNTDPMRPRVALRLPLIATLAAVLVAAQLAPMPASAAEPTPRDIKCQWKKHRKAGRYQACVQNAVVEKVKNPLFDLDAAKASCVAAFKTAWELQDANAAALGEVCLDGAGNFDEVRAMLDGTADRLQAWLARTRFVDNGDGTVTDNRTGLVWEKKTTGVDSDQNLDDPHDVDNLYIWRITEAEDYPYLQSYPGVFSHFLRLLNGGGSSGSCFAGSCDWRLPTRDELTTIVDPAAPGCEGGSPCISGVFGPTSFSDYWSSGPFYGLNPQYVWVVDFKSADAGGWFHLDDFIYVRAVRGGP